MNPDAFRELGVLEEVAADGTLTQRHLARRLRVALGLANLLIHRVVSKGYVKVVSLRRDRIRYLLTPKGVAEKARLTYEFLEYSLDLYRGVRLALRESLARIAETGGRTLAVIGTGEIAEIAFVTATEMGLKLVAVVDDQAVGRVFLGHEVQGLDALPGLGVDCAVVGWLNGELDQLWARLRELGIPPERVVVIEQRGPKIRAMQPVAAPLTPR